MRIVAVADTHTFESDLGSIPDGDVFIHAGDILRGGLLDELEGPAAWIRQLPHAHKIVIAGNHDWCFERDRAAAVDVLGEGVTYLQDSGCEIGGLQFWGSPWQPEFNSWAFNLRRGAEIAAKWQLIPSDCDVLITHGPAEGYGDQCDMAVRAGCADLLRAMDRIRPTLHLFGHIHQDGGLTKSGWTTHANVTTWECERGATVIDVEEVSKTVHPVSVPIRDPLHPDDC